MPCRDVGGSEISLRGSGHGYSDWGGVCLICRDWLCAGPPRTGGGDGNGRCSLAMARRQEGTVRWVSQKAEAAGRAEMPRMIVMRRAELKHQMQAAWRMKISMQVR